MVDSLGVSIILLTVWGIFFLLNRKKMFSVKVYFCILLCMASAGVFLDLDSRVRYFSQSYSVATIFLFSILLLIVVKPWLKYDKWMKNVTLAVNTKYLFLIKWTISILALLSLFTIVYCMPYAYLSTQLGANEVRTTQNLLPPTFFTTIASAVACLTPFGLVLFFICRLERTLRKYSFLSLLLVIAGVVHSMTFAARELYVFLPIVFILLYILFKKSLTIRDKNNIYKYAFIFGFLILSIFITYSISRFGQIGSSSFISGTWGYIYQQPYVFDQTLRYFDNFYEFDRRLMFLGEIFNVGDGKFELKDSVEWSFGTMYNEFYEMYGYSSLFIGALINYLFFYTIALKSLKSRSAITIVVNYTLFIWFTISGLFYFRFGDSSSFLLYIFISLAVFYCPKLLVYKTA